MKLYFMHFAPWRRILIANIDFCTLYKNFLTLLQFKNVIRYIYNIYVLIKKYLIINNFCTYNCDDIYILWIELLLALAILFYFFIKFNRRDTIFEINQQSISGFYFKKLQYIKTLIEISIKPQFQTQQYFAKYLHVSASE
jgi:hypothetical protein